MHLLVDHFLEVPQLLLHAVRQGGVVEAQAEFDVALLGAAGEARAAHQQEAVVDAEELGGLVTARRPSSGARVRMTTAPRSRRAILPVLRPGARFDAAGVRRPAPPRPPTPPTRLAPPRPLKGPSAA